MKNNKYAIKCVITGQDLVRTPKYLREQCQKYGFDDTQAFRDQYIGREGRKLLKEGKTVEEIRSQFNCDIKTPIQEDTFIRFKIHKASGTIKLRSPEKPTIKKDDLNPF